MTVNMNIHTSKDGLQILCEFPENGHSITVTDGTIQITFYLPIEQWKYLRLVFPKHEDYRMDIKDGESLRELDADIMAHDYCVQHLGEDE